MSCCLSSSSSSSLRMKMISLLLLILSSCLCAATFVVNVTQSSYEAEENHSITLEWTFTTTTQGSYRELFIFCIQLTTHNTLFRYQIEDGVEILESQDDQFSGRVQIDKDVLREGRIRLHVSRLRTEDSGLYRCDVMANGRLESAECRLNVTAAADQIKTRRPTLTPEPERGGRSSIFITVTVIAAAAVMVLIILIIFFILRMKRKKNKNNHSPRAAGKYSADKSFVQASLVDDNFAATETSG